MSSPVSTDPTVAHSPLLRLLILLTLATVAVALWYLAGYSLRGEGGVRWLAADVTCDLRTGPCSASLGDGRRLTFEIATQGPPRALEVLPLRVTLEGFEAEAARVDFVGRDMDMGLHRYPLAANGDGVFSGDGQVPICTESVMPWRARVVVTTPGGRVGSVFDFDVERSGP